MKKSALVAVQAVFVLALSAVGCGTGGGAKTGRSTDPPAIAQQPANASVPMGLAANFSVAFSAGSNLSIQWYLNGVAIPGANSTTYTTPATTFADSGEAFTVRASNALGSVSSTQAELLVTARAPLAGDLRFQQVDSPVTVNGYSISGAGAPLPLGCPAPGEGGGAYTFGSAAGTAFRLSNNSCIWQYSVAPVSYQGGPSTAYLVNDLSDLPAVLQTTYGAPYVTFAADSPGSVIMAAGVAAADPGVIALGYVNSPNGPGYLLDEATVDASDLQAAATQEGAQGRVITAMYFTGTKVTYFAYGWSGDPSSAYESEVVSGTLDNVSALVAQLAGEGYIVTASGSAQATDGSGVYLVGTRLLGDTMPRPVLSVSEPQLQQLLSGGYAIVAVAEEFQGDNPVLNEYIGER